MVTVVSDKPVKSKKCICSKCGYKLQYLSEDVQSAPIPFFDRVDYGNGPDTYYYITCPRQVCGTRVFVNRY